MKTRLDTWKKLSSEADKVRFIKYKKEGQKVIGSTLIASMNPSTALRMIELLERAKVFALYLGDSKSWNVVSDSAQWLKDLEEL